MRMCVASGGHGGRRAEVGGKLETSGDAKCTWYVDDRADLNTFKNLLSWANPDLAQRRFNKFQSNVRLFYKTSREGRKLFSQIKSNPAFSLKSFARVFGGLSGNNKQTEREDER